MCGEEFTGITTKLRKREVQNNWLLYTQMYLLIHETCICVTSAPYNRLTSNLAGFVSHAVPIYIFLYPYLGSMCWHHKIACYDNVNKCDIKDILLTREPLTWQPVLLPFCDVILTASCQMSCHSRSDTHTYTHTDRQDLHVRTVKATNNTK